MDCPAQQIGFILNWIKCAEIDDLSEKRLQSMLDLGLVTQVEDLYRLAVEDFLRLPLTKEKMAKKLWDNIQASKKLPLSQFLNGLGIEGAGRTSWEKILETLPSLDKVRKATAETIAEIEGFAEKSANQIHKGLQLRSQTIEALLEVGVQPKHQGSSGSDGSLSGKTFVITGSLSKPRAEIEKHIKGAGGKTSSSVSKNTFAVITNDTESTSSKMKKAKSLNIPVWNEDKLFNELGGA